MSSEEFGGSHYVELDDFPGGEGYEDFEEFVRENDGWEKEFLRAIRIVIIVTRHQGVGHHLHKDDFGKGSEDRQKTDDNYKVWGGILQDAIEKSGLVSEDKISKSTDYRKSDDVKQKLKVADDLFWIIAFEAPEDRFIPVGAFEDLIWPWTAYREAIEEKFPNDNTFAGYISLNPTFEEHYQPFMQVLIQNSDGQSPGNTTRTDWKRRMDRGMRKIMEDIWKTYVK